MGCLAGILPPLAAGPTEAGPQAEAYPTQPTSGVAQRRAIFGWQRPVGRSSWPETVEKHFRNKEPGTGLTLAQCVKKSGVSRSVETRSWAPQVVAQQQDVAGKRFLKKVVNGDCALGCCGSFEAPLSDVRGSVRAGARGSGNWGHE